MRYSFRKIIESFDFNSGNEASQQLKSSLVAINYLAVSVDFSSIIFSSGYIPSRLNILNKGFLLLYYSNPLTATMAAWFFEIRGIPAATISGWSLIRICGPNVIDEISALTSREPFAITFFNYKRKYSWIAVHGIRTKELLLNCIRNQNWNIIEALHNRNFQDVIEILEMSDNERIKYCNKQLEYILISLLEDKNVCNDSSDKFKLQQKLILLSRCSRSAHEINFSGMIKNSMKTNNSNLLKRNSLLAIRRHLYCTPIFIEACISNGTLNLIRVEREYLRSEGRLYRRVVNCENANKLNVNKLNIYSATELSKKLERIIRVVLIELITQLRNKDRNSIEYPSIQEIDKMWRDRFGFEIDVIKLFRFAGLSEEIEKIIAVSDVTNANMT
ncbi:hypothetical protein HWI79_706 [Cryptosporidium felis]|nr:hypothetical protein HWI79_706 [Cryptosporidium felis]